MRQSYVVMVAFAALSLIGTALSSGCSAPAPQRTGFISDYSSLSKVRDGWMRYVSPDLSSYDRFIVDPIEIRVRRGVLSSSERAELANYLRTGLEKAISDGGLTLTEDAGVGVARVRFAITDVNKATWWLNLHPGSKLTGAGSGSAAMEGEVIDSVSGAQLAAVVRSDKGNQFELDTFNAIDDIKDAIDKWSKSAAERLQELRSNR